MKKVGKIGMFITIPLTVLTAVMWINKSKENSSDASELKHITIFTGSLAALSTIIYFTTKK